jgi:hypothetical protein
MEVAHAHVQQATMRLSLFRPLPAERVEVALAAFLDLALGVANPALGLVASGAGLKAVFLASALVVLCAAVIAVRLLAARSFSDKS